MFDIFARMRQAISQQLPESADSIAGVLDHGFELYARSFWRAFVFFLLAGICNASFAIATTDAQGTLGALLGAGRVLDAATRFWWLIPTWLVSFLISIGATTAAYVRIYAIAKRHDLSFKQALRQGLQLCLRSFGLGLLALLGMIGALLVGCVWVYGILVINGGLETSMLAFAVQANTMKFLIMLGVFLPPLAFFTWVVMPFLLAPFLLVRDNLRVLDAITASFRLMHRSFWRSFVVLTVPGVLFWIAYSAVIAVMVYTVIRGSVAPNSFAFNAITQILAIPIFAALMPLFACTCMALINDLWMRREGHDLYAMTARL
jgi:hypothetical protein